MLGYDKYLSLVDVVYLDFQKAYNWICKYNLGPHFLLDKRQKRLERVQRRATKMIPSLSDKSYHHRLISLDLYYPWITEELEGI